MNILITSASRKVELVEAFKKALSQEGGGKVIAVDVNPLSAALYHSDLACVVPRSSELNFIPTVEHLCKKYSVRMIVPTRDEELPVFTENKSLFEKRGIKVLVPERKVVEICQDKKKFIEFCFEKGIPTPKTYSQEEIDKGAYFLPLFIKGRFGKSSKNIFKVVNHMELKYFLSHMDAPIIQEYIEDDEFTIDLFADFEGNIISIVPRQRILVFGGESFIGKTYKNKKLIQAAINLAKDLRLTGHNTIQCFFNGHHAKFIEVNPRYGGGVHLSLAAGANTPQYLIRLLQGKRIKSKIGQFKDGLIMLRYTEDTFIDENAVKEVERFN